jgi:hypothetical protein
MKMAPGKVRVAVAMPGDLLQIASQKAREQSITMSEFCCRGLRQLLESENSRVEPDRNTGS